jgi:hypothetical protein
LATRQILVLKSRGSSPCGSTKAKIKVKFEKILISASTLASGEAFLFVVTETILKRF